MQAVIEFKIAFCVDVGASARVAANYSSRRRNYSIGSWYVNLLVAAGEPIKGFYIRRP
jgi:hypothetical protein